MKNKMSDQKKTYVLPKIAKYSSMSNVPPNVRAELADILNVTFRVAFDEQRVYRQVPSEFARLLGYESEELAGRRHVLESIISFREP